MSSNPEGDAVLAEIRREVIKLRVPAAQQEAVVMAAAHAVIAVLTNPQFLNRIGIVIQMQHEIATLRQMLAVATQARKAAAPRPRKAAPRKAPAKKAAKRIVKTAPKIQVKGSTAANRKAFNQGYRGG